MYVNIVMHTSNVCKHRLYTQVRVLDMLYLHYLRAQSLWLFKGFIYQEEDKIVIPGF